MAQLRLVVRRSSSGQPLRFSFNSMGGIVTFVDGTIWHHLTAVSTHSPAWVLLTRMLIEMLCAFALIPCFDLVFAVTKPEELLIEFDARGLR